MRRRKRWFLRLFPGRDFQSLSPAVGIVAGGIFCLAIGRMSAQPIKVDINQSGRQLSETSDPAFTPWSTNANWMPSGANFVVASFNGLTITFNRVGPAGTNLRTDWWKEGIDSAAYTAKLANDGLTVENGNGGAQIEMRIQGLSPGAHSLLAYLNTWQNPTSHTFAPLDISVNGALAISQLVPSNRVTNNADSATAYLEFSIQDGQDVVVLFQASTNDPSITDQNVCLDGFEIDTPNLTRKASKPVPPNGDEHVDADATRNALLSWTAAASAISHEVYFGTESNAVHSATLASPEFIGSQTTTNLLATNLGSLATYYWRIDERDAEDRVTEGDVWRFRTRHLAFPGAEGYGRFARGGRGGKVVEVTNLNDSGPGSLRDAITNDVGPRTVVFAVSGLITLESRLTINQPYITIAGQTAPGKGICIRKWTMGLSGAHDVIVRDVRVRPGNLSGATIDGMGMQGSDHCIFDHCSISWSIDEAFSSRSARNITLQRTLISEALNDAGHQNYPPGTQHGYAASIGGDVGSFHHNLLAHCEGRNWSLAGGLDGDGYFAGRLDIRNNVVYNWGHRATDGGAHEVNFVGNYYKPGPATDFFYALNAQYDNFPGTQQYYFAGNVMPGHFDESNETAGRTATGSNGGSVPTTYSPWVAAPFFESYVDTQSARDAYKLVLSDVGCTEPKLDDHDARVIEETRDTTYHYSGSATGLPGLPDSQSDVGGWEDYPEVHRPAGWDSDQDGLPDWWEVLHGLNPNSPPADLSDANGDPDGDEFTNLEDYLHWLAGLHFDCPSDGHLEVDLSSYARGFTLGPVYSVTNATNGTVEILTDGKTARFMPASSFEGLGGFQFTVTDAQGSTMTRGVGIHVTPPLARLRLQLSGSSVALEIRGESGHAYTVQYSSNLLSWTDWTNVSNVSGIVDVPLAPASTNSQRFYRTLEIP